MIVKSSVKSFALFFLLSLQITTLGKQVCLAATPEEIVSSFSGLMVGEVSVVSESNLTRDELLPDCPIVSGATLELASLEATRTNLLARGTFEHVSIEGTQRGNIVDLTFRLQSVLTVRDVEIVGIDDLDQRLLRSRTQLRPGERLSPESLDAAMIRLKTFLQSEGYPEVEVTTSLHTRVSAPQRTVRFLVQPGPVRLFKRVNCDTEIPIDIRELVNSRLERFAGQRASKIQLEEAIWELVKAVRREGYIQARVLPPISEASTINEQLQLKCDFRRPVQFVFQGNRSISAEDLISVLALDTRRVPFSVIALPSVAREMEELYQERGYFFAQVDIENDVAASGERHRYQVRVKEGELTRLTELRLEGVESLAIGDVEAVIPLRSYRWRLFKARGGLVTNKLIGESLSEVTSLYERRGYPGTTASFGIESSGEGGIAVVISVAEAAPVLLRQVLIEGAGSEENELRQLSASLVIGAPIDLDQLEKLQQDMAEALDLRGYPESTVNVALDPSTGEVLFRVTLTDQVRVRRIRAAGNFFTRDGVISRELTLAPGEFVTRQKIDDSVRALYRLGLFRDVAIGALDGRFDSAEEDILVNVSEHDSLTVGGAVLFNTDDGLNLNATITQRNWRGEGESVVASIDTFFKSGEQLLDAGRLRLGYREPYFLGERLEFLAEGYLQNSIKLLNRFSYDLEGVRFDLRHKFSPEISALVGAEPYFRRTYDVPEDIIIGEGDVGTTRYAVLRSQFSFDNRDDTFNPRQGIYSLLTARLAADLLGAETEFAGLRYEQNSYLPLSVVSPDLSIANRVVLDYLTPFGESDTIPLGERFFLGGRNSLRGFSPSTIGPRGRDLNIVGGDSALVVMTELLFDITPEITFVSFLDFGQTTLRHAGSFAGDTLSFSWSDIRYSPGLGVRYRTPIGPLGVEYGFALDREYGEGVGVFNISIGGNF